MAITDMTERDRLARKWKGFAYNKARKIARLFNLDTEDLQSEAMVGLAMALNSFITPESARCVEALFFVHMQYLVRGAIYRYVKRMRSLKRDPGTCFQVGQVFPDEVSDYRGCRYDEVDAQDEVEFIKHCISQADYELLSQRYMEGMNVRELAEVYGLSKDGILYREKRAMSFIHKAYSRRAC